MENEKEYPKYYLRISGDFTHLLKLMGVDKGVRIVVHNKRESRPIEDIDTFVHFEWPSKMTRTTRKVWEKYAPLALDHVTKLLS